MNTNNMQEEEKEIKNIDKSGNIKIDDKAHLYSILKEPNIETDPNKNSHNFPNN